MIFWENTLIRELDIIIKHNVKKLAKMLTNVEIECQQKWKEKLKEEVNECCIVFLEEASCFVAVKNLRETYLNLCKSLQTKPLTYDEENITLHEEKKLLEDHIQEFQKEIINRQNRFTELSWNLTKLCESLQKTPRIFARNSVPTQTDLKELSLEVLKLEKECEEIIKNFNDLKIKIKNILQELSMEIQPEYRSIILSYNVPVTVCKTNFNSLTRYYEELRQQQQKQEYEQLESLKNVINALYNTCHIAQNERKIRNIHQHTLDIIQMEISDLKKYWEENKNLLSQLGQYKQHWRKLLRFSQCFDTCSDTIMKTIKKFCKQIYNIEIQLVEAAVCYEGKYNKSFTSFGQTMPDIIAKQHSMCRECNIDRANTQVGLYEMFNEVRYKNIELTKVKSVKPQKIKQKGFKKRRSKNNINPTTTLQNSGSLTTPETTAIHQVFIAEAWVDDSLPRNAKIELINPFESKLIQKETLGKDNCKKAKLGQE